MTLSGNFTGATLDSGWTTGGSGYTPVLTASSSATPANGVPAPDSVGSGWLQLTSSAGNQATYAYDTSSFAAAHATITATFNYASFNGTGADGITFFLADSSQPFSVGAYGGSLGYAQKTSAGTGGVSGGSTNINGMNGGYIGVGIDEYGNFSNGTEGRIGGNAATPNLTPNAIAVRGPGQGLTGYNYLGGTGNLGANSIAFPGSTTRPTSANQRTIEIVITATNQMTVYLATGGGTNPNFVALYSIDLSGYTRPNNLVMGFTAGTGGSTDVHQVQNVALSSVVSNLWTNTSADSTWATAGNWNNTPAKAPASGSDILLDNTFVNSAQNISVSGNNVIRNLQIDAPFSYTLTGGSIEFNGTSAIGPSGIFVSQTHGSAAQTINSNITADNAIQIQNNSSSPLTLTGTVGLGNNTVTFNGSGATTLSGVVSGSGATVVQSGTGNTTLSGANTYTGGTTLSAGTLTANNNTALGTGAVVVNGGTLASTTGTTISNIVTLQGNAGLSGITSGGTLTQTNGNYTLNMAGATQSGTVNLSNTNTAQTLTVQVDSGTSTISGVIQNGGTSAGNLTKTGTGTLVLSGTDTYTGTTTISNGAVQLGNSNTLAATSSVSIGASGNLLLNGKSQQIATLTAAGGASLDFGTAGGNTFVFGTYNAPGSGVLTVSNYVSGSTVLASTVSGQTVSSIYLSGYGNGVEAGTPTTTAYGSDYLITPAAQTWKYWDGTATSWSGAGYWSSTASPTFTSTTTPSGAGVLVDIGNFNSGVSATPTLGGNTTLGGIRFDPAATQTYTVSGSTRTLTMSQTTGVAFIQQQSSYAQNISVGTLALSSNTVLDTTGSGNLTVSSVISGTSSLTKTGTGGTAILTGANTYSGGTAINDGTLRIGNNAALGTGAATVAAGATLETTGGITASNALNLNGSGVASAGAVHNISGSNTLSGTITESGATTFAADTGTTLGLTGNLTGTNTNTTFASASSGTGAINVNQITTGTGTVTISSGNVTFQGGATANTYTGLTTVSSGTLNLSKTAGTTAIAGNLTITGGTVNETTSNQIATTAAVNVNGGTFALSGAASNTFTSINSASGGNISLGSGSTMTVNSSTSNALSGAITGTGALSTAGTGSVTLGGNNTYSGGTTVASIVTPLSNTAFGTGTVAVSSGGSIETQNTVNLANNFTLNSTGTTAYNGAIENISGNSTVSGTLTLAGTSRLQSDSGTLTASNTIALAGNTLNVGGVGNTTLSGALTGTSTSSLTKDGTGTLALSGANSGFAGTVIASAGTIVANAANVFNSSNVITVNTGSILNTNDFNQTIASLTSNGTLNLGAGTGDTLTLSSGSSTLGGFLTGAGTIIVGPGASLTLTANFNDPNVNIILNGGSLNLNGTTDTFGSLSLTGNSVLDFGNSSNSILNTSSLNVGSSALSITNWTDGADGFYTQNFVGATTNTRGSAPENQITFSTFSASNTAWQSFDHQLTPVPEPGTYGACFIGLCLMGMGVRAWRKRAAGHPR